MPWWWFICVPSSIVIFFEQNFRPDWKEIRRGLDSMEWSKKRHKRKKEEETPCTSGNKTLMSSKYWASWNLFLFELVIVVGENLTRTGKKKKTYSSSFHKVNNHREVAVNLWDNVKPNESPQPPVHRVRVKRKVAGLEREDWRYFIRLPRLHPRCIIWVSNVTVTCPFPYSWCKVKNREERISSRRKNK